MVTAAWNYIDPAAFDFKSLLPRPTAQASEFELPLIAGVRKAASENAKRWANEADADSACDLVGVLDPSVGHIADAKARVAALKASHPATCELLLRAEADSNEIKKLAKAEFRRERPAGGPLRGADSYPSGHATRAATQARLLAAVVPSRERELASEAWYRALCRVTLGVHHPSDITAGYILGEMIGVAMLDHGNERFRADLDAARAEWKSK